MIKKLFYILIILFTILFILNKYKYFKLNYKENYKENFQSSCNNFFKGNTFCQLNKKFLQENFEKLFQIDFLY